MAEQDELRKNKSAYNGSSIAKKPLLPSNTAMKAYGDKERDRLHDNISKMPLGSSQRLKQYGGKGRQYIDRAKQQKAVAQQQSSKNNLTFDGIASKNANNDKPSFFNELAKSSRDFTDRTFANGLLGVIPSLAKESLDGLGQINSLVTDNIVRPSVKAVAPVLIGRKNVDAINSFIEKNGRESGIAGNPVATDKPTIGGDIIPSERGNQEKETVGINGGVRPDVPVNPFNIETGIDVNNMAGGAFGGLAGLNQAIAALTPYHAAMSQRSAANKRKLDMQKANKPIIEMQTLPDGREVPLVMDRNGTRLNPNDIDPNTGLAKPFMSLEEMTLEAAPRIEKILADDKLNKDAKRARLEMASKMFTDAGYDPINIDELL